MNEYFDNVGPWDPELLESYIRPLTEWLNN